MACYGSVLWCVTEVCYGALRCVTLMRYGVSRWRVTSLRQCVIIVRYGGMLRFVTVRYGGALRSCVTAVRVTVRYGDMLQYVTLMRYGV